MSSVRRASSSYSRTSLAGVLDECPFPQHGEGEEERVEPRIVEALADVAPGREHEALLAVGNVRQVFPHASLLEGTHSTLQDDEMAREPLQPRGQGVQMIPPLGEDDGRAFLLERSNRVAQNQRISLLMSREGGIELLDRGNVLLARPLEAGLADDQPLCKGRCSLASRVDGEANKFELHLRDGMLAVAALRSGRQSDEIAGLRLGQHPLERDCGQVVALVDYDLAVGAHGRIDPALPHQALDHRDVEPTVRGPLPRADPTDLPRPEAQEHGELRHPLLEQGPAVHQDERAAAAGCDEPGRDRGLSGSGRSDEDSGVVLEERSRRSLLCRRERALEVEGDLAPRGALVAECQGDTVLAEEGLENGEAAPGQREVLRKVLRARDDPRRHGGRESHALPLVELGVLEGR